VWVTAEPVTTLGRQVEGRWPQRHSTDGTVASKNHDKASPRSDHRPKPVYSNGTVRAIDIGVYLDQGERLFQELRASRDPRIKYVIFQDRMFSSYDHANGDPFEERPYSGTPHTTHIHVSTLEDADDDGSVWDIGENMLTITQLQEALVEAGHDLDIDGDYGPLTQAAFVESLDTDHDHDIDELAAHAHKLGKTGGVIR
jgi:hypothetical protein